MSKDVMQGSVPRPLAGGVALAAASRVGVSVVGALTTITLARILGPQGWGTYFVAQSLILILIAVTTLGVEHGIAYFVSSGSWGARAAFDFALKIAVIIGSVGAAVGFSVRLLVPSAFANLSVWLTGVVVAALPFSLAWFYTSYIALATDRYEIAMVMPFARAVLVFLTALPASLVFGVAGAVVALTVSSAIVGAASVLWGWRRLPRTSRLEDGDGRRAVSFGIKGYAANALSIVNYQLDLFVLSAVASTKTVGQYSLAVALTTLLWLLPRSLSDVLFPRIARLSRGGDTNAREKVEAKSLRHASLVVFCGIVAMAIGLELFVVPVFGSGFRPAVNLGLILLPGTAAIGLSTILAATVVGRGKPVYSLVSAAVTSPTTLALYILLIPRMGAAGAALASTIAYATTLLLFLWFYRRTTGRPAVALLVPTRSELQDLTALTATALAKARAPRLRR